MFLLDTNVISELRRPEKADKNVLTWCSTLPLSSFFISAITVLELELGALQIARRDTS
jgi:toxin FitB